MKQSISISPLVHAKMMAHAIHNPRSVVHGILLGSFDPKQVNVTDVLPVFHSTPTKPILDMALRLADAYCISTEDDESKLEIIGWYTAPEKDIDESPGPVALKIISSIAAANSESNHQEHILVCITNKELENFLKIEKDLDNERLGFSVYACNSEEEGKWNSQYSVGCIKSSIGSWSSSNEAAVQVCLNDDVHLIDFEDHLSSGADDVKKTNWITNQSFRESFSISVNKK